MKIGMLFPDYGSQYVGMGKELYDLSRVMQEYFEEASTCLDKNFVKLCFASSEHELALMENAYPAIFLLGGSIGALLKEKGVQCQAVAGYGIGQLTALHVAGSLTLPDGLYFLSKYAQFYQHELEQIDGTIICISGIPVDKVKKWCAEFHHIAIAAYHSLTECVVSGLNPEIVGIKDLALKMDARVTEVPVQSGMHSKLMAPVEQQMRVYLEKIDFHDFNCPLISGVDGTALTNGSTAREHTMKQLVTPIYWDKVMQAVADWQLVVQCGPGSSLKNLVENYYPEKKFIAINNPDDVDTLLKLIHE